MKKFVLALVVILVMVSMSFGATAVKPVTTPAPIIVFYTATPVAKVALVSITIDSLSNLVASTCTIKDGTTVIRLLNLTSLVLPFTVDMFGVSVQNPKVDFGTNSGTAVAVVKY